MKWIEKLSPIMGTSMKNIIVNKNFNFYLVIWGSDENSDVLSECPYTGKDGPKHPSDGVL